MPGTERDELVSLSVRQLKARRRRLAKRLTDPEMTLRGSVVNQMRRCGKPGCRCAEGELHGPYVYLSLGRAATPRLVYVPAELAGSVRRHVALTEAAEDVLVQISAINLELLARRELD